MRIEPQITYRYAIHDKDDQRYEFELTGAQLVHLVTNMIHDYMDQLEATTLAHGTTEYRIEKIPGHDWHDF
jgi:hypothetical protein